MHMIFNLTVRYREEDGDFSIGEPGNTIDANGDPKEVPNHPPSAYSTSRGAPSCRLTSMQYDVGFYATESMRWYARLTQELADALLIIRLMGGAPAFSKYPIRLTSFAGAFKSRRALLRTSFSGLLHGLLVWRSPFPEWPVL